MLLLGCTQEQRQPPSPSLAGSPSASAPVPAPDEPDEPPIKVTCDSDEKTCANGEVVVRGGPLCDFAPCPDSGNASEGALEPRLDIVNASIMPETNGFSVHWATTRPANASLYFGETPLPVAGVGSSSRSTFHYMSARPLAPGDYSLVLESCDEAGCVRKTAKSGTLSFPWPQSRQPRPEWMSNLEITVTGLDVGSDRVSVAWNTSEPTDYSYGGVYEKNGSYAGSLSEYSNSTSHVASAFTLKNATRYYLALYGCVYGKSCAWAAGPDFLTLARDPTYYRLAANLSAYLGPKRLRENLDWYLDWQNYWVSEGASIERCWNGNARLEGISFPGAHGHAFVDAQGNVLAGMRDRQDEGRAVYEAGSQDAFRELLRECYARPTIVEYYAQPVLKPERGQASGFGFEFRPWHAEYGLRLINGKISDGTVSFGEGHSALEGLPPVQRTCLDGRPVCAVVSLGQLPGTTVWRQAPDACSPLATELFAYGNCTELGLPLAR